MLSVYAAGVLLMKIDQSTVNEQSPMYVLVEEEVDICNEWLRISLAKDIHLMTYPDPDWFLRDLKNGIFLGNERFYLDQDFGQTRGVGIKLSRLIKSKFPNAYTSLVTAYPRVLFRRELHEGVVNDVFGKYPSPFNNPAYTAIEKMHEREVWGPFIHGFPVGN